MGGDSVAAVKYPPLKTVEGDEAPPAMRWCGRCRVEHPAEACRLSALAGEAVRLCPTCGMITREIVHTERAALWAVYLGALRYPLQQEGAPTLLALAVGAWLLGFVPIVGGLLAMGAVLGYLFLVVRQTGAGRDALPQAADFTGFGDLIAPAVRFLLAGLVALAPLAWASVRAGALGGSWALVALAGLWAMAWMPAATAVAAHQDGCLGALNPVPVVQVIARIPADYARTVAALVPLCLLTLAVEAAGQGIVRAVPVPVLSTVLRLVASAAGLYGPLVMARVLGLLLRERAEELGL